MVALWYIGRARQDKSDRRGRYPHGKGDGGDGGDIAALQGLAKRDARDGEYPEATALHFTALHYGICCHVPHCAVLEQQQSPLFQVASVVGAPEGFAYATCTAASHSQQVCTFSRREALPSQVC